MLPRKLVGIAAVVVLALVLCGILAFNYFSVEQPLHHVLSQDSRNQVVAAKAYYDELVDWNTLVFDIRDLSGNATEIDVFRTFLQYAEAMKGKHFAKVILACRGKKKFTLDGTYFQQLGQEYENQDPAIGTFPTHLTAMDGSKPFTEYVGGVLGVLEKETEQFTEFNNQWYIRDMAAQIARQQPQSQGSVSEQQPKPDYSHVKKDMMGESVALFLANNPRCRFDLPDDTFPKSGSKMCVVVDREHMFKGKPAQITYAGMPVQIQAHFYNDALFNLTFMTISDDDCQTYHILDMLKEKYGDPKETQTVNGKESRPAELSEKNPFLFWQDGTITITYSDALTCSVSFEVDKITEAVSKARDAADSEKYRSQHRSQKSDM